VNRFFPWIWAAVAVAVVASWQWATVHANYQGNWTALFCTGALQRHPPLVASEHVYLFPGSTGYDGQFYHYIAHDPLMRSDLKSYMDDPNLRYRRILVPMAAHVLATGLSVRIDQAYEIVFLLSVALGVYWSSKFAEEGGLAPSWGILFLAMPAVVISMDRMVLDASLAALTAGFLVHSRWPSLKLFGLLAAAPLVRETGLLLAIGYIIALTWKRKLRSAALFGLTLIPAAIWFGYVQSRTRVGQYGTAPIPWQPSFIGSSTRLNIRKLHPC